MNLPVTARPLFLTAFLAIPLATAHAKGNSPYTVWFPIDPGVVSTKAGLANRALSVRLGPSGLQATSPLAKQSLVLNTYFSITLRSGRVIDSRKLDSGPKFAPRPLGATPSALRSVERAAGQSYRTTFLDQESGLKISLQSELRDGANWGRTTYSLTPMKGPLDVASVTLIDGDYPGARVLGTTSGSPIVMNGYFASIEHPMAVNAVTKGHFTSSIVRKLPLEPGQTTRYSVVIGTYAPGQLRRGFLRYLEAERARPYAPFLHYNSWYDLGYFSKYTAEECKQVIRAYGEKLIRLRGAKMASFLFDDGWDDPETVWGFNSGFPKGFRDVAQVAKPFGASPGAWLSPWGGYGPPRKARLATAARLGYEFDSQGYALSGPKYYERFRSVCIDLVLNHGINQFKLDGTGSPDKKYPGSKFGSDFDAAIALIDNLRTVKPSLFINLTTGTWPSPFWTRTADSIWRGGEDHSFAGVGTKRQQWITYRDGDTYRGIVRQGPLYPLNSLMLHGIIYAKHAHDLNTDPGEDFRREVLSYFGTGTQLQEMYVSPELMTDDNWDALAVAARWSAKNADTMVDSHWVGGDPNRLEVYGHAAWNGDKAILVLRNPSDKPQAFGLEPRAAFELPAGVKGELRLRDVYLDTEEDPVRVDVRGSKVVELRPFEVLTLQGKIVRRNESEPREKTTLPAAGIKDSDHGRHAITVVGPTDHPSVQLIARFSDPVKTRVLAQPPVGATGTLILALDTTKIDFDEIVPHVRTYLAEVRRRSPKARVVLSLPVLPEGPAPLRTLGEVEGESEEARERREEETEEREAPWYAPSLLRQAAREMDIAVIDLEAASDHGRDRLGLRDAIDDLTPIDAAAKKDWRLVSFTSEQAEEGPAQNSIDGDPNTYWHSQYDPKLTRNPHELVIDLGKSTTFGGVSYLPRQDGGTNGFAKHVTVTVSDSPTQWGEPTAKAELKSGLDRKRIRFSQPVTGRYVRFVIVDAQSNEPYASAAEIGLLPVIK